MTANGNSVEMIGHYGGDLTHALSAWTSTSRDLTESKRERIPALLKTLAHQGHHTPFEKSMLHFLVRTETASHIHLLKHRVGVSVNAESARYKEIKEDRYYVPRDWPDHQANIIDARHVESMDIYHMLMDGLEDEGLTRKRAKETARFVRPYAQQIGADVSFNFRSFFHFLTLRYSTHAQVEIREIARLMLVQVAALKGFQHTLEAFGLIVDGCLREPYSTSPWTAFLEGE